MEIISDSFVQVRHDVADMEELADGVDAMEEICQLLRDYLPKAQLNWFSFQLSLLTDYGENQQYFIYQREDWDAAYARQLLYLDFKADVEEGLVSDVGLSQELLDAIPQKYIRSLYINGKPYQSEDYEICFLYNILDETYYTRVGFGVKLNYNGGVEDYLQREIIESYYPEAEYTISPRAQTSTYTIGADQYLVKRRDDGLTFFKNDTELQIAAYQELSGTHTGATYYFWVSVDDFATLLGMTVDKVEEDGVYLLLPTSSVPSDQAPSDVPVSLSIR